jgi:parallel beta-helix repeat protein
VRGVEARFVRATITRSVASGNGVDGILLLDGVMSVAWTAAAENGQDGFAARQGGRMTLESCVAHGNDTGISVTGATAHVSNCTVTNNSEFGFLNVFGTMETRQNNTVRGNGQDIAATLTPISGT